MHSWNLQSDGGQTKSLSETMSLGKWTMVLLREHKLVQFDLKVGGAWELPGRIVSVVKS